MNVFRTTVYYLIYPICRLAFFLVHPVFRVTGRENIPDGPYILCCNHSSGSDPFWVIFAVRPKKVFRYLAKIEFARMPVVNVLMRAFGVIFVDRGHHDTAAMEKARADIRGGDQMMIFPEGTRVKPGREVKAKCGAIQLASECGVPILPMYLTKDKKLFRPIQAVIGRPYDPIPAGETRSREEMKVLAAELMEKIYQMGENVCA